MRCAVLIVLSHAGKLSRLYQMIDLRLASLPKFLELSGRLDVVLSHAPAEMQTARIETKTGHVYVESDSEEQDPLDDSDADDDAAAVGGSGANGADDFSEHGEDFEIDEMELAGDDDDDDDDAAAAANGSDAEQDDSE